MKSISCSPLWAPVICKELDYVAGPLAQCIVCTDNGKFVAGVLYDGYNGGTVGAHIVVKGAPLKEWFVYIFDYPYHTLGVRKIIVQIAGTNQKSIKLAKSMGFSEECRIAEYYEAGHDLIVMSQKKEDCKVLTDQRWRKLVEKAVGHGKFCR